MMFKLLTIMGKRNLIRKLGRAHGNHEVSEIYRRDSLPWLKKTSEKGNGHGDIGWGGVWGGGHEDA